MLSHFLTLTCDCDEALRWTRSRLARAGLRSMQTFDLHMARHALGNCPCPHHGTAECDCQMVVLLVYGAADEPLTLILHGNEGVTWVSFAEEAGRKAAAKLLGAIRHALEELPAQISNRL